jgi:hypothetical protein
MCGRSSKRSIARPEVQPANEPRANLRPVVEITEEIMMRRSMFQLPVLACALAFAPAAVRSQSTGEHFPIGIWAGVTAATIRGSDATGPTNIAGFSAGIFTQRRLAPHWALQPEVQYTQKGSDEVAVSNSGSAYSMHIRVSYVEVPVLLRFEASPVGAFTPFAVLGPEVAFKTGCGLVLTGLAGDYTCASLPPAESVDYGGIAGAGVAFRIAGRTYGLSARYDLGLANAFANNEAKNRAFTVLLGTVFR